MHVVRGHPAIEASPRPGVLSEVKPCLVGIEACRLVSQLVERADGTWPYRAMMQPAYGSHVKREERHGDAEADLRSSHARQPCG